MDSQPGISVIICCYNSAERLFETLSHLAKQQVSADLNWEIIVVDNASIDQTAPKAIKIWQDSGNISIPFTVLEQSTPGKNYAFDVGLSAAKYDYVLTCDDDNWLHSDYIQHGYRMMNDDPRLGALGGTGIYHPEEPRNREVDQFKTSFVNGTQDWALTEHWVYGAGSIYRKQVLELIKSKGWSQITTGRTGKKLICGEDVEFCWAIYLSGYRISFSEMLRFEHFVPLQRQSTNYIESLIYWQAYSYVLLSGYLVLLDNQTISVKQKLDRWLWNSVKTQIRITSSLMIDTLCNRKNKHQRRNQMRSTLGTIHSLLKNKKQIILHAKMLTSILGENK